MHCHRECVFPFYGVLLGAGTSSTAERKALMKRYLRIFGARSIKILLADREFIGSHWFEFSINNNIPFAIRLKAI